MRMQQYAPFGELPSEMVYFILRLCTPGDLCNLSCVCKQFYHILQEDSIWKDVCNAWWCERKLQNHFALDEVVRDSLKIGRRGWKWIARCLSNLLHELSASNTPSCTYWKELMLVLKDGNFGCILYLNRGEKYVGYINSKQKFQGQGIYVWPGHRVYEGGWLDGKKHGAGTYYSGDGVVFTGEYVYGKRGNGTIIYPNGETKICQKTFVYP
jgi:hypothetical protein